MTTISEFIDIKGIRLTAATFKIVRRKIFCRDKRIIDIKLHLIDTLFVIFIEQNENIT